MSKEEARVVAHFGWLLLDLPYNRRLSAYVLVLNTIMETESPCNCKHMAPVQVVYLTRKKSGVSGNALTNALVAEANACKFGYEEYHAGNCL
jgi:hypothetical protein